MGSNKKKGTGLKKMVDTSLLSSSVIGNCQFFLSFPTKRTKIDRWSGGELEYFRVFRSEASGVENRGLNWSGVNQSVTEWTEEESAINDSEGRKTPTKWVEIMGIKRCLPLLTTTGLKLAIM
jgi:hypothetical protein